jgi:hypothetical protein
MTDESEPTEETERMCDVDHTQPDGASVNRVYERGREGERETERERVGGDGL